MDRRVDAAKRVCFRRESYRLIAREGSNAAKREASVRGDETLLIALRILFAVSLVNPPFALEDVGTIRCIVGRVRFIFGSTRARFLNCPSVGVSAADWPPNPTLPWWNGDLKDRFLVPPIKKGVSCESRAIIEPLVVRDGAMLLPLLDRFGRSAEYGEMVGMSLNLIVW